MKKPTKLLALAVALVACASIPAEADSAFRAGPGIQMTTSASVPTTITGRRTIWVRTSDNHLMFYNGTSSLDLSAGATIYNQTIEDEGTPLTQRTNVNFTGAGVSCADSGGKTVCTISGGGSSTLATAYSNGASQTDSTIGLDSTRLGVRIRDNATPISGALFSVENSTGATQYLYLQTTSLQTPSLITNSSGTYTVNGTTGLDLQSATSNAVRLLPGTGTYSFYRYSSSFAPAAATSGNQNVWVFTGPASTGVTASTEQIDAYWALNRTVQHATGALSIQRAFVVEKPSYSFVGASTITDAATLAVVGAPAAGTNATITNSWSLWSQDGAALLERDGVGATIGTLGLLVQNRTAATSGNQKYSPTLALEGQGWKTNATAASQSVRYELQTIPIQGAAAPTGELRISESINGGAETTLLQIGSSSITASVPIKPAFTTTTVAPSWSTVSYTNSWVDYSGSATTRYTKDAQGIVTLEVKMKTGTNGLVAFTLPTGYRPSQVVSVVGQTLAGAISTGDLAADGTYTPTVSSGSGVFLRAQFFAEN